MQPLYFNALSGDTNFIGTNPLQTTGVPIKTTLYPYFNPSIYQSFTFNSFPIQTTYSSVLIGNNAGNLGSYLDQDLTLIVTGYNLNPGDNSISYSTIECYSIFATFSTQFSTFETFYASYFHLQPVTYSVRFGTEVQSLFVGYSGAVDTFNTYEFCYSTRFLYYSYIIQTVFDGTPVASNAIAPLASQATGSGLFAKNVIGSYSQDVLPGTTYVGSSSFVNLMGSNVYSGLMDTTNSIIIYQNEQVSSYYSQSLSYQVNIANLTAALNSVSGSGDAAQGEGDITVTNFSWTWESTAQGWTGSQNTTFDGYLSSGIQVNSYLSVTYGGTVITNASVAVTQVQSLITVQNNDLSNSQTFMNNAVTTLQSQVSLAGQIIGTLSSIMQSIINNI